MLEVFERHGFVWGGKWLSFDPIHFEYRPEVLLLSELRAGYDD
ncbi:MAG: M15 family metallopeptidase [Spirochaeta sp.]|nr:M15 family metallopeptidase [Spirochaeta sp.]